MTVFTRTWNASYEATPANGDDASEGANRIRDFKTDVAQRLVVDHSWDGDANDGMHKQITFADPLVSKPNQANDETYLYSKDVDSTSELFYEDEAGNEVQLTSVGLPTDSFAGGGVVTIAFYANTAPSGWTIITTLDNHMMRVVQGSETGSTGGVTGGSDSPILNNKVATHNHTASSNSTGAHTHTVGMDAGDIDDGFANKFDNAEGSITGTQTKTSSSNGSHSHTITVNNNSGSNWTPQYASFIIASKD